MLTPWQLNAATSGSSSLKFGTLASQYVFESAPSIATPSLTTDDTDIPRGDGVLFGEDFRSGTTITFDITVNGADETEARSLLQDLSVAWRGDYARQVPGRMVALVSHTNRIAFGRPRRFATVDDLAPFGITAVTCDFATVDDLWYGPQQTQRVTFLPALGGGLVAPLAAPLSTTQSSDRSQAPVTISGNAPTWPVYTIYGPITNPQIEVTGQYTLGFNLSLSSGQSIVVDTRPFARTIRRNGASIAGLLDPKHSRLSQASLAPGTYPLVLRGQSTSSSAGLQVAWRDAFTSY